MANSAESEAESSRQSQAANDPERQPTTVCEAVFAALGLLLVLGTVGFLIYRGATTGTRPPVIQIKQRAVKPQPGGYVLEVDVRNSGDRTAAALTLEGELELPGGEKETSDVTLDYVPSNSHRRAGFFFQHDPQKYAVKLRAKGYQEP